MGHETITPSRSDDTFINPTQAQRSVGLNTNKYGQTRKLPTPPRPSASHSERRKRRRGQHGQRGRTDPRDLPLLVDGLLSCRRQPTGARSLPRPCGLHPHRLRQRGVRHLVERKTNHRREDVEQFPGHIACSSESRSEIVVPLYKGDEVIGVLDIDSEKLATFDAVDKEWLEQIAEIV